jgi:dipeptidyl aminopeptidase/acylaminoacyl peptidase
MNRRIFWPFFTLTFLALACTQTSSSQGSMRDIYCALQGISPEDCNQTSSGPANENGEIQGGDFLETPSPTPTATPTLTPTPTPTPIPELLQVVYAKSGNIWLWERLELKQLTSSGQDSDPKISDDGLVVAFRRNGELWAINVNGTSERVLASPSTLIPFPDIYTGKIEVREFDFAPETHNIYFNTLVAGGIFPTSLYDLAIVNADSPSAKLLLKDGEGGDQFVLSPDGSKIALVQNGKINIANPNGSNLKTVLTFLPVLMYGEQSYIPQIVWMPDSSGFKTVIPPEDGLNRPSDPSRFFYISADGGQQPAQLAQFVASPPFVNRPYISPDGSKVLYVKPQATNLELHVIDASTADRLYSSNPADRFGILGWAPDSVRIIYWTDDTRRTWLGSQGIPAAPLSDVAFADKVTWVDAERYLFMNESELRMRTLGQPSELIDSQVTGAFDFLLVTH